MMMIWMLVSGLGCAGKGGICDAASLEAGSMAASVDGADWSNGDATWSWAGASLQVDSTSNDGWRVGAVAQLTTDGVDLETAIADGVYPIEVDLSDGGFVTLYPEGESFSYVSNKGAGGTLYIESLEEGALAGCFDADAASTDGAEVSVAGGAFHALEAALR